MPCINPWVIMLYRWFEEKANPTCIGCPGQSIDEYMPAYQDYFPFEKQFGLVDAIVKTVKVTGITLRKKNKNRVTYAVPCVTRYIEATDIITRPHFARTTKQKITNGPSAPIEIPVKSSYQQLQASCAETTQKYYRPYTIVGEGRGLLSMLDLESIKALSKQPLASKASRKDLDASRYPANGALDKQLKIKKHQKKIDMLTAPSISEYQDATQFSVPIKTNSCYFSDSDLEKSNSLQDTVRAHSRISSSSATFFDSVQKPIVFNIKTFTQERPISARIVEYGSILEHLDFMEKQNSTVFPKSLFNGFCVLCRNSKQLNKMQDIDNYHDKLNVTASILAAVSIRLKHELIHTANRIAFASDIFDISPTTKLALFTMKSYSVYQLIIPLRILRKLTLEKLSFLMNYPNIKKLEISSHNFFKDKFEPIRQDSDHARMLFIPISTTGIIFNQSDTVVVGTPLDRSNRMYRQGKTCTFNPRSGQNTTQRLDTPNADISLLFKPTAILSKDFQYPTPVNSYATSPISSVIHNYAADIQQKTHIPVKPPLTTNLTVSNRKDDISTPYSSHQSRIAYKKGKQVAQLPNYLSISTGNPKSSPVVATVFGLMQVSRLMKTANLGKLTAHMNGFCEINIFSNTGCSSKYTFNMTTIIRITNYSKETLQFQTPAVAEQVGTRSDGLGQKLAVVFCDGDDQTELFIYAEPKEDLADVEKFCYQIQFK
ncbi:hypothetical protein BDEG_24656 [Batrachochytrium dendrobatidis JEL423]|uniref:Uncharacterized protein n=1 Tax=Batrachochytrium dendrobatidis (strain JEL423) TaxID=403673 RepID=A0A177WLK5_BATDL|nr:hypothetical protein BDEG_24656 [Batrachochytrium dendrobatidis JEL423]